MARTRALRKSRFESLEQRQLLAGDVLVSVVDGRLLVEGDAVDNKVVITAGAEAGEFIVKGLDGTNLIQDGQAAQTEVTVAGVHSVKAELGEGDDLIALVGANLRGRVAIDTGAGNDRAFVGTGGDAAELAGELPDDLSVRIRGSLWINTDGGNDQVAVDDATMRRLAVHTGVDADVVSLGSTAAVDAAGPRVQVRGGAYVNLGDGSDELNMNQLRARGGIVARGGAGEDTIEASSIRGHAFTVIGGADSDTVVLADLHLRHLGVHTGEGNDRVDVRDSVFASLGVTLGDGNDTLTTAALEARIAVMFGGDGEDTFELVSENHFAHQVIRGFEIPADVNVSDVPFGWRPLRRLLA